MDQDTERDKNFKDLRKLVSMLSKEYTRDFLRLLIIYRDISASEAAARLNLHIKTAQDFLEVLEGAGIVEKRAAAEKKRPYFRYALKKKRIQITIDLNDLYNPHEITSKKKWRIRERKNSGVLFKEGRDERISAVFIFQGDGRARTERRLSLTDCQGRFLFHLPFPTETPLEICEICKKAGVGDRCLSEIIDLVEMLEKFGVVEISNK
ncbi:MAG: helix-turn-helix transcriptional regulator [Candidatus Aminicenantes bacterium]|nr:helix-turn-helix transcriptional regulator [Candidatus Aminicenantes bacterium]